MCGSVHGIMYINVYLYWFVYKIEKKHVNYLYKVSDEYYSVTICMLPSINKSDLYIYLIIYLLSVSNLVNFLSKKQPTTKASSALWYGSYSFTKQSGNLCKLKVNPDEKQPNKSLNLEPISVFKWRTKTSPHGALETYCTFISPYCHSLYNYLPWLSNKCLRYKAVQSLTFF